MGKKMNVFPLKSGMSQMCPLSSLLFLTVLECLAKAVREAEKIKVLHLGKEAVKVFLLIKDMILYLKYLKYSTKKNLSHH
jgi:hypothetical protein